MSGSELAIVGIRALAKAMLTAGVVLLVCSITRNRVVRAVVISVFVVWLWSDWFGPHWSSVLSLSVGAP
jgi:hypothetical protein